MIYAGPSYQGYGTPWHIVRALERERARRFDLDVCAEAWSAKAPRFIGLPDGDGLVDEWDAWNFGNFPYRTQGLWLRRAAWWATQARTTACLVRAATDARYWFRVVVQRATVDYVVGRIPFIAPPEGLVLKTKKGDRVIAGGARVPGTSFASAVVWYGPEFAPGVVRWRDAATGELLDLARLRELRAEAA